MGHQAAGGGALRAEGKALALELLQVFLRAEGLQTSRLVGDEHRAELGVHIPLRNDLGARGLQAGLHPGEPPKPNQIQIPAAEASDSRAVIHNGLVLHWHAQLITEFFGQQAVEAVKPFGVLIRDRADAQHLGGQGRGHRCQQQHQGQSKKSNEGDQSDCRKDFKRLKPSSMVAVVTAQERRMQRSSPKATPGTTANPC